MWCWLLWLLTLVQHATYTIDLVDDASADLAQEFGGEVEDVGSHEVGGLYGSERELSCHP